MTKNQISTFILFVFCVFWFAAPHDAFSQVGKSQGLLDVNIATEKELSAMPHMNAKLVTAILERRPFGRQKDFDQFLREHLTETQRAQLYAKLFVHLNLNTASNEEILMIPGLGDRMLHEFLEYRPYKNLAHFRKEIGKYVDDTQLNWLGQYVFVPIPLNTATDEAILSIPGVGNKMLHEFKEYRPYKNIEQFRREIGKYVDKKEVARLERYVTLN
jgi:DNA uptake protein ComE-like DNA-binding protein